jgi:hypothetical protein
MRVPVSEGLKGMPHMQHSIFIACLVAGNSLGTDSRSIYYVSINKDTTQQVKKKGLYYLTNCEIIQLKKNMYSFARQMNFIAFLLL